MTSRATTQTSRFLLLPPELRTRIYQKLLSTSSALVIDGRGIQRKHFNNDEGIHPSVVLCCQQTYNEAFPIIYTNNRFTMSWSLRNSTGLEDYMASQYATANRFRLIKHFILPADLLISRCQIERLSHFSNLEKLSIVGSVRTQQLGIALWSPRMRSSALVTIHGLPERLSWFQDLIAKRTLNCELSQMIIDRPGVACEFILTVDTHIRPNTLNGVAVYMPAAESDSAPAVAFEVSWDRQAETYGFVYAWDRATTLHTLL